MGMEQNPSIGFIGIWNLGAVLARLKCLTIKGRK